MTKTYDLDALHKELDYHQFDATIVLEEILPKDMKNSDYHSLYCKIFSTDKSCLRGSKNSLWSGLIRSYKSTCNHIAISRHGDNKWESMSWKEKWLSIKCQSEFDKYDDAESFGKKHEAWSVNVENWLRSYFL